MPAFYKIIAFSLVFTAFGINSYACVTADNDPSYWGQPSFICEEVDREAARKELGDEAPKDCLLQQIRLGDWQLFIDGKEEARGTHAMVNAIAIQRGCPI